MIKYEELVKSVCQIARAAGADILEVYESSQELVVDVKADDSPLTRADRAAHRRIVEGLRALEFQAPIISEEGRVVPFGERSQYTRYWLVDPLDGTKEFIKHNGEFTVNIALIDTHSPLLGVVYVPVTDEMYYAILGRGAYRMKAGKAEPIQASRFRIRDNGLRVFASRSHPSVTTQRFLDQLQQPNLIRCGSSLKFLRLAAGEADLYPRFGPTSEWDTAAAQIILEEAGGRVYQVEDGKPMVYNKREMLNPHFIAEGKRID